MKLCIEVYCRDSLPLSSDAYAHTNTQDECLCRDYPGRIRRLVCTTDPSIMREVLQALLQNRQLESDEDDIYFDKAFTARLPTVIDDLTAQIRQNAIRQFSKGSEECPNGKSEHDKHGTGHQSVPNVHTDEGNDA